MDLTIKDRLQLINQYKILAKLSPDETGYYEELIEILENGYKVFYSTIANGILEEMSEDEGGFVLNILDLYRIIESVKRRKKDEKIAAHVYSYFRGFDGNHESEYMAFVQFLVHKQNKYSEQKNYLNINDDFNSHAPMKEKYERMLSKWDNLEKKWEMNIDEILEILDA